MQSRPQKRKRSPVTSLDRDDNIDLKKPSLIPNLPVVEDQIMTDLSSSLNNTVIYDDYTEAELVELYPLWMSASTVDVDTLLYKD